MQNQEYVLKIAAWKKPGVVLLITTAGIFLSELVAMVFIYLLPPFPYAVQMMIDAAIMTALIFPLLYFLIFRQLLRHVRRQQRNEMKLQQANDELQALTHAERDQRRLAEALLQATSAISESLDLEEVLARILTQIGHVTSYHAAAVLLVEGEKVTFLRHRGFVQLPEAVTAYRERGFDWDAFPSLLHVRQSGEPLFVPDIAEYGPRAGMPGFEWVQSFMVAPLKHKEQLVGIIVLLAAQPHFFNATDFTRLLGFTVHAELAISNARLFEREAHARSLATELRNASISLAQSLELDVVCNVALDYVSRLAPFQRAGVVLLDGEASLVERVTRAGTSGDVSANPSPTCGESFCSDAFPTIASLIESKKSLNIADASTRDGWRYYAACPDARSWLGIPLVADDKSIGFFSLERVQECFREDEIPPLEALAAQTAITIQKAWLFEQARTARERLQSLSRRLVEVQESERNYIARELHDEAGQALAALTVDLRVLEQHIHEPAVLLERVTKMDGTLQNTISGLHRLAMALRPAVLDHVGLHAALHQHGEHVAERYGLEVYIACDDTTAGLPGNVETTLYRIVQEALTNVVRHARASRVDVLLKCRANTLILVIEDDGVGFDPGQAPGSERLGLLGMRERIEMLAGQLTVESAPGKGTGLHVEIPYVRTHPDC